ncbi:MAG: GNAT family N-acetyltransferase [Cyanobacteria bacterium P01_A01_bin.135]
MQQTSYDVLIRAARRDDIGPLSVLLTDSFHPPGGAMEILRPLLQLGIREDLRYRLQKSASQYACLVAVHRSQLASSHPGINDDPSEPLPSAPLPVVGTLELSVRRPWWTGDRYIYISNVAVDRRFRRRGIAQRLLQASEGIGRSWGLSQLQLHVMADNAPARQLYGRAGYTVQNDEPRFEALFQRSRRISLRKNIA